MDNAAILARFLDLYRADLEGGGLRPSVDYQALFPGFERLIAHEYAVLASDAPRHGATSGNDDPSRVWIGPFRVIEELARGGQGEVYLAEDPRLHRQVAVKVLRGTGGFTQQALARFRREAEVTARLDHPGICPVYESGTADGIAYIAMKFIPGRSLAQQISDSRSGSRNREATSGAAMRTDATDRGGAPQAAKPILPDRDAIAVIVGLARQVALALHAAHENGIIHRDVKPGNVMVTPTSEAVLVDFGFAREDDSDQPLTHSGDLFGTPAYMSPEQLARQATRIDRRTDVWSLGVTLYEALTLVRPFEAPTREALHRAILTETQRDPRSLNRMLPKDLRVVLETALEKDRERRYQTAGALADDLAAVLEGRPVAAKPAGHWARLTRWAARKPAKAGLVALTVVASPTIAALGALRVQDLPRIEAQRAAELHAQRDAHLLEAHVIFEAGDAVGSIDRFRAAIELDAVSVEATIGLAMAQHATGRHEDALQTLDLHAAALGGRRAALWLRNTIQRKLDSEAPQVELPPPRDALDYFLEGQQQIIEAAAGREGGYPAAKSAFLRAIFLSSAPRLPFYTFAIEAAGRSKDRDTVELLDCALCQHWPDSGVAHHWRGIALSSVGDVEGAIAAYGDSIRYRPDAAMDHFNLGNLLARSGRLDEAIAPLSEAIRLQPSYSNAHCSLGSVYWSKNRLDEALDEYTQAIAGDPSNVIALRRLGALLTARGRPDEAADAFQSAIALDPSDADSHFNLGAWHWAQGRLVEASEAYLLAINARPDFAEAYGNLGLVLGARGELEEALEATHTSVVLDPRNARSRVNLSDMLIRAGRFAESVEAAQAAIAIDPTLPEAHCNLGYALRENGELGAALVAMQRGHELASTQANWTYPSGTLVGELEDLVAQEQRMLRVAAGHETAQGSDDQLRLADLAYRTKRWHAAAGWYSAAIEARPELLDSRRGLALRAARAVAQACGGEGSDSKELQELRLDECAALRSRALEWMRRELYSRRGDLGPEDLARALGSWRADPLLASLRDEAHFVGLPAEEVGAWREFWFEVEAALR